MFEESASIPSIWASMNSWFTPAVLFVLLNLMIGTILFSSNLTNQQQQQQQQEGAQYDPQRPKPGTSPSVLQRLRSIKHHTFGSQEPDPSQPITTHFKQNPDSDTHFPPKQTHQQELSLEAETQYLFDQTLDPEIRFVFEQTQQLNQTLETETHFDFETQKPIQSLETETQLDFEQTHIEEEDDLGPQSLDEVYSNLTDRHVSRTKSDTKPASGEVPERLPQKMKKSKSLTSAFGHFEENDVVEARRPATVRERKARVTEVDDEVDAKADDFINKFKQQLMLQKMGLNPQVQGGDQ